MTLPVPLERDVQRAVVDLYRQVGCVVYSLSQGYRPGGKRHGTTRQSKGLPDLIVCHVQSRTMWSHETKRPGGQQSLDQVEYERVTVRCGLPYVIGGVGAACLALRAVAGIGMAVDRLGSGDRLAVASEPAPPA